MNPVSQFFVNNYALFCICIAMVFIVVQNLKTHRRESFFTLLILGVTLLLSALHAIEYSAKNSGLVFLATLCGFLGYTLRPLCAFFFIRLADSSIKKTHFIFVVPLILNMIVYSFALFINVEALRTAVFYFTVNEDGTLLFNRGFLYLNFFSHVVSALYLGFLIYVSIKKLKGKHISHAITILICAFFIIVAVAVESIFSNKDIQLLNITIAIGALFYYLFLYSERSKCDPLTGLFNRETYYSDLNKMGKSINAVVQLDMNGLKWINDNQGHQAGDNALTTLGRICEKNAKKNIYAYRLGGDEFTLLVVNGNDDEIKKVISQIKADLKNTEYYCSVGYAIKENGSNESLDELLRRAEMYMYLDKEEFYKDAKFERRKQPK